MRGLLAGLLAQNAPPKNESDCGVTSMCHSPTPAHHTAVASWSAELLMFAVIVVAVGLVYRLLLARNSHAT